MKWINELIGSFTLVIQLVSLYYPGQTTLLNYENGPLFVAILVFIIGVTGGVITHRLAVKRGKDRRYVERLSIFAGAKAGAIGVYFVLVPLFAIIYHSAAAAILLFAGIFAPWAVPKIMNTGREKHA